MAPGFLWVMASKRALFLATRTNPAGSVTANIPTRRARILLNMCALNLEHADGRLASCEPRSRLPRADFIPKSELSQVKEKVLRHLFKAEWLISQVLTS